MSRTEGMTITAAAIYHDGMTYSMAAPKRHSDIVNRLYALNLSYVADGGTQGFMTNTGKFVRREPALRIAREAFQLKGQPTHPHQLFSEDIW